MEGGKDALMGKRKGNGRDENIMLMLVFLMGEWEKMGRIT